MYFVVRFKDKPESLAIRQKFLSDHLLWLDQHQAAVLVAGSLRAGSDAAPEGALWIVEAESKAAVEELFQTDPFWAQGLRESYEIFLWSKAFPERKVPV
ncbi:MAG TPA: YciI family protein [Thermoanaerobaculia bacterium]|nr:YciI family protein [Thermoanaerobaculia bacterium]